MKSQRQRCSQLQAPPQPHLPRWSFPGDAHGKSCQVQGRQHGALSTAGPRVPDWCGCPPLPSPDRAATGDRSHTQQIMLSPHNLPGFCGDDAPGRARGLCCSASTKCEALGRGTALPCDPRGSEAVLQQPPHQKPPENDNLKESQANWQLLLWNFTPCPSHQKEVQRAWSFDARTSLSPPCPLCLPCRASQAGGALGLPWDLAKGRQNPAKRAGRVKMQFNHGD